MSHSCLPPLIQTLAPERWAGWSMDFIDAGYTGLLMKNGQLVRQLSPGRHFSFALPWLEQCQLVLVDSKLRNLEILSQGDFLSRDQYLVNVSLNVMYQVLDPKRVALELSDPLAALVSAIKDNLGVAINQMRVDQLINQGRVQIRQYLLDHLDACYLLGFTLDDVRVSDISFPQTRGVIRQVEGMSAREEEAAQADLQMKIAEAGRTAHVQQVNLGSLNPAAGAAGPNALPDATLESTAFALPGQTRRPANLPAGADWPASGSASGQADRPTAAPTVLSADSQTGAIARLVHRTTGATVAITTSPFTIGREPGNGLVVSDPLCSRYHARIIQFPDPQGQRRYQVVDIGSSNGTWLGNQRLATNSPVWLLPGNTIRIGEQEWEFEL